MKRWIAMVLGAGLLLAGGARVWALTTVAFVTPQNAAEVHFKVSSKAGKSHNVDFVIRRDVRGIDGPGRSGYLSNPAVDGKSLGRPVKLEERDNTLTYRFSVPEDQVADTRFTLWGQGLRGEGVTFELKLRDFWKPAK